LLGRSSFSLPLKENIAYRGIPRVLDFEVLKYDELVNGWGNDAVFIGGTCG